jgi:hypothetical protein
MVKFGQPARQKVFPGDTLSEKFARDDERARYL